MGGEVIAAVPKKNTSSKLVTSVYLTIIRGQVLVPDDGAIFHHWEDECAVQLQWQIGAIYVFCEAINCSRHWQWCQSWCDTQNVLFNRLLSVAKFFCRIQHEMKCISLCWKNNNRERKRRIVFKISFLLLRDNNTWLFNYIELREFSVTSSFPTYE